MGLGAIERLAIVATLLASAALAAAQPDYRLAGTIATGADRWIALIELPGGGQRTVRVNDRLGAGTVVAIADRRVRIAFPEGERELRLGGSGRAVAARAPIAADGLQVNTIYADERLIASLRAAEQAAAAGSDAGTVQLELNRLLGLPPEARVIRVRTPGSAAPPATAGAALLRSMHTRLARGHFVQLFLGGTAADEIYVMPPQRPARPRY